MPWEQSLRYQIYMEKHKGNSLRCVWGNLKFVFQRELKSFRQMAKSEWEEDKKRHEDDLNSREPPVSPMVKNRAVKAWRKILS